MTIGPWKPVYLEFYEAHVTDLDIRSNIKENLDITITVEIGTCGDAKQASFVLKNTQGQIVYSADNIKLSDDHGKLGFELRAGQVELWYPIGYGGQPIYYAEVVLSGKVLTAFTPTIQTLN
jgi:beta-mannosidase